ncbi:MAG: Hydroxymethylglutaryl-CoA reductase, partial [uncultured Solirubrobacteraceae bacterium]
VQQHERPRPGPARSRRRLHARRRAAPARVRDGADGRLARARRQLLVRPGHRHGQRRAVHGRRAGADRPRGAAAGQRRARPGRVLRPARDRRGDARRLLQPRHAPAPRGGRRDGDDHGRPHAARAGVPVRERPRLARVLGVARRPLRRDPRGRRGDDADGQAAGHRALQRRAHALHALQLHDGRRGGPEPHRQGDAGGVPVDRRQPPGDRALLPRVELRDGQEVLAGQHAAHARQAGDRGGDDPQRAPQPRHALGLLAHVPGAAGLEPRRLHVGRQQQRRALGQRDHRDVHRDGPGRRQRRGVERRVRVRGAARRRRLLLLDHHPGADRRDLRRRHEPRDAARVPRAARVLRQGQGRQAHGDRRRDRPVRRALARLGDRRGGVGRRPRPVRAQPEV